MERATYRTAVSKAILKEYLGRDTLQAQDVVKCFLKIYSAGVSRTYDRRIHLWNIRPGDVVYVDGIFSPMVSRFLIDDGDRTWRCIHLREKDSDGNNRRYSHRCIKHCRKWYGFTRKDSGTVCLMLPDFDGLTTIPREDIGRVLRLLKQRDKSVLRKHFDSSFSETLQQIGAELHSADHKAVIDNDVEGRTKRKRRKVALKRSTRNYVAHRQTRTAADLTGT